MAYMIAVIGVCGIVKFTDVFCVAWLAYIGRMIAYIGKNSLYYYPITGYVPAALVKMTSLIGVNKNIIIVMCSKIVGFAIATMICLAKKKK